MGLKRVSGLWLKDGKAGKFMSGKVQDAVPAGAKLLVFRNERKRSDGDPDYTLHIADDDDDRGDASKSVGGRQPAGVSAKDQRAALSDFESERQQAAGDENATPF